MIGIYSQPVERSDTPFRGFPKLAKRPFLTLFGGSKGGVLPPCFGGPKRGRFGTPF